MNRIDMSDWVIHFVHDRNPENGPKAWDDDFTTIPIGFDEEGQAIFSDWDYWDAEYSLEPDASAFSVIKKILFDGHIRAGWSFRNGNPTIYGPFSVVCFTEMPLHAFLTYAEKRRDKLLVGKYGIALLKSEFFLAGGRPVIYGLTSKHDEAKKGDSNFSKGLRCLSSTCGIGLNEQYRYVSTNLCNDRRRIDWTHEREWRWANVLINKRILGLPIWLKNESISFSKILVLVNNIKEANEFLDKMKEYYDSGSNNFDYSFCKQAIENTSVITIEEINQYVGSNRNLRIEDLPLRNLPRVSPIIPSEITLLKVKLAVKKAKQEAILNVEEYCKNAKRDKQGKILSSFGHASVKTYKSHSEITQALIQLNYAKAIGGLGYYIDLKFNLPSDLLLDIAEIKAETIANTLSKELGQPFFVESRLD